MYEELANDISGDEVSNRQGLELHDLVATGLGDPQSDTGLSTTCDCAITCLHST